MGEMAPAKHELIIISGPKNAGKTKVCLRLIEMLQDQSVPVSGLVSPGLYRDGRKTGILVRDIACGDEMQLAVYEPGWDPQVPEREWRFNMEAVIWGNKRLKTIKNAPFLLIDEMGFLEMEQNRGWTAGLDLLDSKDYHRAVVVIRPDLLEAVRLRWQPTYFLTVHQSSKWDKLARKIMDYLSESA